MKNKLGLNDLDVLDVEEALVAYKSSLLNEKVSFNQTNFNLDYLIKLNDFLFGDLYTYAGKISSRYTQDDHFYIHSIVDRIVLLIESNSQNVEELLFLIKELIDMQIFECGNKRTILLFLNSMINAYKNYNKEYFEDLQEDIQECVRERFIY